MKNTTARNIVANLGKRYRFVVKLRKKLKLQDFDNSYETYQYWLDLAHKKEAESWNAFESSRRILYVIKG